MKAKLYKVRIGRFGWSYETAETFITYVAAHSKQEALKRAAEYHGLDLSDPQVSATSFCFANMADCVKSSRLDRNGA